MTTSADEQGLRELGQLLSAKFEIRKHELRDEPDGAAMLIQETGELLHRAKRDPLGLLAERRSQAAGRTSKVGDSTPATAKSVPDGNHGWDAIVAKAASHLHQPRAALVDRQKSS